ncbi:MAG: phytoene desaturase family protein [Vicinamibacterales bacterium]
MPPRPDAVVVGAGHNGLVAAIALARSGLSVVVCEADAVVGGAARTEYPFTRAPGVGASSGAYLLGLMPPEVLRATGLRLPLIRRDPHYFLPTTGRAHLLFGSDRASTRRQCLEFFSERDWLAIEALGREIGELRDDLAPSWLEEPAPIEQIADRYVRPHLRRVFLDLAQRPVEEYLARFGFESPLILAMYAVTDGFSGLSASFGMRGTGLNFLVHNMCRLPGSAGTWMVVEGGMGRVTQELARLAAEAGVGIRTFAAVSRIDVRAGRAVGVTLADGNEVGASVVVSGTDPFTLRALVGAQRFPEAFNAKLERLKRTGTTLKVNFALDDLPPFRCLPEPRGQYRATIHLLPQVADVVAELRRAFDCAQRGELPEWPAIEWYTHTAVDPTLQDERSRHSGAFFVQWVPYELRRGSWDDQEAAYARTLFEIADLFAPGFSRAIVDVDILTPKTIERRFGMTYGHIHHVDNTFGFDERMPYATPIDGLYACGAGCHPAGSVIGAAGLVAARRVLRDMGWEGHGSRLA